MKKFVLIILILTTFSFDTQKEDAFDTGEYFKFRIHYGIVNAGYATLEIKDATINNKKVHHAIGKGYTTGMSKFFLKSKIYTKVILIKKLEPLIVMFVKLTKAATLKIKKVSSIKPRTEF